MSLPAWRVYHNLTKHTPESVRRDAHSLDWNNMPDPFRHYEGVPLVDLPADPPAPSMPMLEVLAGRSGAAPASDPLAFLSQLLFYSASISASKQAPSGVRYALRVNPSSGNLHPTGFHLATPDALYHYRVSSHMLEERAAGNHGPLTLLLTTIAWREAWKYQARAYRYCLLDAGHACESVSLAARALGCEAIAHAAFDDAAVAKSYGLAGDEWPLLLLSITGGPAWTPSSAKHWYGGTPNRLSDHEVRYRPIEQIHAASALPGAGNPPVSPPFGEIVRRRRSALDFEGGSRTISFHKLLTLIELAARPQSYVRLYLYVHRVEGLAPGVYRHSPGGRLDLLRAGDQRVMAAALSLGQELAGNACVAFSMIGDLDRAARDHGDRGYRYVHFEAGAIGQRLYLAAEALGFQSTGIGAFYDDEVNRYLEIPPESGQVVYHFACGYAVDDARLEALV